MGKAQFVLAHTQGTYRYLSEISTSATPIGVVYPGIDADLFTPNQPSVMGAEGEDKKIVLLGEDRPLRLLSVGSFSEQDDWQSLIAACALLKQMHMEFHCTLVGCGSLTGPLLDQIEELELGGQMTVLEALTPAQPMAQYRQTDVFVLPCQITGRGRGEIPTPLLEAMAMGLPVVATPVASIPELIRSGSNGLLVPPQDPGELANALVFLALNEGIRQYFGQAGQVTIHQHFTLERQVADLKGWLLTALRAAVHLNQHPGCAGVTAPSLMTGTGGGMVPELSVHPEWMMHPSGLG